MSALTDKIEEKISNLVKELDCEVVRIAFLGSGNYKTLQIMIERIDRTPVTISDCEKVSKAVSIHLDVMDPIKDKYNLEVSSTGIDRPLVKAKDFIRFCGNPVVVKTYDLKNERKIFKGILEFATENGIRLDLEAPLSDGNSSIEFTYEEIRGANLDGQKL